jgi:hypothetical protein
MLLEANTTNLEAFSHPDSKSEKRKKKRTEIEGPLSQSNSKVKITQRGTEV